MNASKHRANVEQTSSN